MPDRIYVQPPLFDLSSDWRPPSVATLPAWRDAKRVAVDIETCDPGLKTLGPGVRRGSFIAGVSFAIEGGPAAYLPIAHATGENLPREAVLAYLRDQATSFTGEICGANLQYDLDFLEEAGVAFRAASFFRDVQIAEPLLDELQYSYSLESVAQAHGFLGKNETHLQEAASRYGVDPKADIWKLPPHHVGRYAEEDARLPLRILERQERQIEEQGLRGVYDLESRCLPILLAARRRGVRVDLDRLEDIRTWCGHEIEEALAPVRVATGNVITGADLNKGELVARVLKAIGLECPFTKTGRASVKSPWLEKIDHPVARAIVRARRFDKVRGTFCASIERHAVNGRIHPTFNQLRMQKGDDELKGAAYGRISCSDPNLQQQPARDEEIAARWRAIYRPDADALWASADYSQQEPRWTVHYAVLSGCPGAEAFADVYRANPDADCYELVAQAAKISRKQSKGIFLGLCYGMGGAKLCRNLGLPTVWVPAGSDARFHKNARRAPDGSLQVERAGPEGQALLDLFNREVPFVKDLAGRVEDKADARGYIRTHSGRRCRFPPVNGGYDWTYKALNRLIQGSSADQTKMAMVELDRAGFKIQLQVHDEIDLSVASIADATRVGEIMRDCVPMLVPAKVDVATGISWGDAK